MTVYDRSVRHRVTLGIALASLSACGLTTDFDGFSGGVKVLPDAGDSGSTNTSSSSSSGSVTEAGPGDDDVNDAGTDAPSGAPDAEAGVDAAPPDCTEEVLVGSNLLAPTNDDIDPNFVDAYGYAAAKSGIGHCIWLYVNLVPTAPIVLGVYANDSSTTAPGKLLAEASIDQPKQGWNSVRASLPIEVTTGITMWIGVNALKTGLGVRVYANSSCGGFFLHAGASTGSTHAPSPFPSTFNTFTGTCNVAAYVSP